MTLEELKVLITAETSGLKKAVNQSKNLLKNLTKTVNTSVKSINTSFSKIGKSISNAFKPLLKMVGIAMLARLGKQAVETASDLAEIQNVVDVAFGSANKDIDKWAKSTLKNFGIIESEAKNIASTFKAMSNSMGVDDQAGRQMATRMTELAGDLASFRNTSVEQASNALQGIYTGQAKALLQYGVAMTEANLQQYAQTQGIKKSVASMSQAEKVALRYAYVLQATADAQGDFARTSNSWANQIKILRGQWISFLGVLGTAIKQILNPLLITLNNILASIISITKAAFTLLGVDFDISNATASAAVGAEGIGTGLDDATGSAKKLKNQLAGFDELNILGSKDSGLGEDLSDALGGVNIDPGTVETTETETAIIGSLGQTLDKINNWFDNTMTPWLDEKAKWLAGKINTFTANAPWSQIGSTAANGLNGVITALDTFLDELEGYDLGDTLGKLLNGFTNKFDAKKFGKTVSDSIKLGFDFAIGFLDTYDFGQLGKKIGDWFNGIDWATLGADLGDTLSKAIKAGIRIAAGFFETADGGEFAKGIANFIKHLDVEGIWEELKTKLGPSFSKFWEEFWGQIKVEFPELTPLLDTLNNIKDSLIEIAPAIAGLAVLTEVIKWIGGIWASLNVGLPLLEKVSSWLLHHTNSFNEYLVEANGGVSVIEFLKAAFAALGNKIAEIDIMIEEAGGILKALGTIITSTAGIITAIIAVVVGSVIYLWNTCEIFRDWVKDTWDTFLKPLVDLIGSTIKQLVEDKLFPLFNSLKDALKGLWNIIKWLWDKIAHVVEVLLEVIIGPAISMVLGLFGGLASGVIGFLGGIIEALGGVAEFFAGIFTGDIERAAKGIGQIFEGLANGIANVFIGIVNGVIGLINGVGTAVSNGIGAVIKHINKISVDIPDWVPFVGGGHLGFNIATPTYKAIPYINYLAKGGILDNPTLAMLGEYPGAGRDPEIAAPQSLLRQTIVDANGDMVNALYQMATQIIDAIDNVEMNVEIGDDVIANSAKRGADDYRRRTGRPMFA